MQRTTWIFNLSLIRKLQVLRAILRGNHKKSVLNKKVKKKKTMLPQFITAWFKLNMGLELLIILCSK
uniref:Uncharacterized protein n=1 Tax=Ixodes scapularis TaxID=6945 RepID=A0A4D5RXC3_IXOSC